MLKLLAMVFLVGVAGLLIIPQMLMAREKLMLENGFRFEKSTQNYRVLGEREPIILVHGSLVNDPWEGFEERLAESRTVYMLDLPGFGASETVPGQRHTTNLFARSLCAFIQFAELEEADVVGLSLGGVVAAKSAAQGCFIGRLITVGLPGEVKGEMYDWIEKVPLPVKRYLASTGWAREHLIVPMVYENADGAQAPDSSGLLEKLKSTDPKAIADVDYRSAVNEDLRDVWPQIENEVMVVYGENDVQLGTTSDLVSNPIVIEGAGHNVLADAPEEMVRILNRATN